MSYISYMSYIIYMNLHLKEKQNRKVVDVTCTGSPQGHQAQSTPCLVQLTR